MTAIYNPETTKRMIAGAREDDARMTAGPWEASPFTRGFNRCAAQSWRIFLRGHANPHTNSRDCDWTEADAAGIARTRNNLRAMADQLEAAQAGVVRLTMEAERAESHAKRAEMVAAERKTEVERLTKIHRETHEQNERMCREVERVDARNLELQRALHEALNYWSADIPGEDDNRDRLRKIAEQGAVIR